MHDSNTPCPKEITAFLCTYMFILNVQFFIVWSNTLKKNILCSHAEYAENTGLWCTSPSSQCTIEICNNIIHTTMSNMPFTDRRSLARNEKRIARERNQFLFNTVYDPLYLSNVIRSCSLQPTALSPCNEATVVQIMQYIFPVCIYVYAGSHGYSAQFTADR